MRQNGVDIAEHLAAVERMNPNEDRRSIFGQLRKKLGYVGSCALLCLGCNRIFKIEDQRVRSGRQRLAHAVGAIAGHEQQGPQPHRASFATKARRRHSATISSR